MEAKDTVMNDKQIRRWFNAYSIPHPDYPAGHYIAEAQAEITGKIMYEEGFKAGIREVVGELGLHTYLWHDEDNNQHICIGMDTWQAKLKEWKVKNGS